MLKKGSDILVGVPHGGGCHMWGWGLSTQPRCRNVFGECGQVEPYIYLLWHLSPPERIYHEPDRRATGLIAGQGHGLDRRTGPAAEVTISGWRTDTRCC